MRKKPIFDDRLVTQMMCKFEKNTHRRGLRDAIMLKIIPLIDAAISRKRLFKNRDDLRQECALKVLLALPKFRGERGTAFAFLWSVICNTCITHGERLTSSDLSLEDDEIKKVAEFKADPTESPFRSFVLTTISDGIVEALGRNGFRFGHTHKGRRIASYITKAIASGELFSNRTSVSRKLRKMGIDKREAQFFIDHVLVMVRVKLYTLKELKDAARSVIRETGAVLPEILDQ